MHAVSVRPSTRSLRAAVLALCIGVLALLGAAGSAKASTEHQFCWGANIPAGSSCQSAYWNLQAVYASGWEQPVCAWLINYSIACESNANEGAYVYVPGGGSVYTQAAIFNRGYKTKAYGIFWTP